MSEEGKGFSKLPNGDKEGLKIQNGFSKENLLRWERSGYPICVSFCCTINSITP